MARPKPQAAISKAPTKAHPVAPAPSAPDDTGPRTAAPSADAPAPTQIANNPQVDAVRVFSARISTELHRRVRVHAAATGTSVQEITAAALAQYLDRHQH